MRRTQQESERLSNRARDSRAQDEKIARLRVLRLEKEALDLATKSTQPAKPRKRVRPAAEDGGTDPLPDSDGA
jgi:hypothetical protein